MKILGKTPAQWQFSDKDRVDFLQQWKKADKYQLTTKEFCSSLVENGRGALKIIGQAGLAAPGQGQRFVDVLEGWFPALVLTSIRTSEKAGQRVMGLETAIDQLQGGENIVPKLVRLLAFPYALCVGMSFYGVEISDRMLATIDYAPGIGVDVRDFVISYGASAALAILGLLTALSFLLPYWAGRGRPWVNDWPIFSLYRTAVAASMLKTLANLTSCGMKLGDALKHAGERNTVFALWHLNAMQAQSVGQSNLGRILDTGLLLPSELSALKVLGERVSYPELLRESSANHREVVDKTLANMQLWLPKAGLFITILLLGALIFSAAYQLTLNF